MPKNSSSEPKQVRLLVDSGYGKCNDVVSLPVAEANMLVAAGHADDAPEAVAYALTLKE